MSALAAIRAWCSAWDPGSASWRRLASDAICSSCCARPSGLFILAFFASLAISSSSDRCSSRISSDSGRCSMISKISSSRSAGAEWVLDKSFIMAETWLIQDSIRLEGFKNGQKNDGEQNQYRDLVEPAEEYMAVTVASGCEISHKLPTIEVVGNEHQYQCCLGMQPPTCESIAEPQP